MKTMIQMLFSFQRILQKKKIKTMRHKSLRCALSLNNTKSFADRVKAGSDYAIANTCLSNLNYKTNEKKTA